MAEKSIGITTKNPTSYIAGFEASEQADGQIRVIQIVSLSSGKIPQIIGSPTRSLSSNDSLSITSVSGVSVGDNNHVVCYVKHKQPTGSCVVTPLLCDSDNQVMGTLVPKLCSVGLTVSSGTDYLSPCLSWDIGSTGAWTVFPHITDLSDSNVIDLWLFTI